MKARTSFGVFSVLLAATVLLGGCLDEKRDRITEYEPGVYKGRPDMQLSEQQRKALRDRAMYQGRDGAGQ